MHRLSFASLRLSILLVLVFGCLPLVSGVAQTPAGKVVAYGLNESAQLGTSAGSRRDTPASVPTLSDVTAVAGGWYHSLALKSNGTVWAWGTNAYGQLGDGTSSVTTDFQRPPMQVLGLTNVTAIKAGSTHSLALKSDGTVWAWGHNMLGTLGDGTNTQRNAPVRVSGLTGIIAIAAGTSHNLAVKEDGTVWSWGHNGNGQLGDGTTLSRFTAVQVASLSGIISVTTGMDYSLAVKNDGTLYAWGANDDGQLGDGTEVGRKLPVAVLSEVRATGAGYDHTLAIKSDGTVWTWGRNDYGQLGDGTLVTRGTPLPVSGLADVKAVAAGMRHSVAVKNEGTVWGFGMNLFGQLGDGTNVNRSVPVRARYLTSASAIACGQQHTIVVAGQHNDDLVANSDFATASRNAAATISVLANDYGLLVDRPLSISSVTQGARGSVAIAGSTLVYTCATDSYRGSDSFSYSVTDGAGHSATATVSVMVLRLGTLVGMGWNHQSQVGDGTTVDRSVPVPVMNLTGVRGVAGGEMFSLALKTDGTVWSWGSNTNGYLGDGTTTQRSTPVKVSGLTDITAIASGELHSLALRSDGTVWAWGYGPDGQLGDNTATGRNTPVQVVGLTDVVAIAAGGRSSMALKNDGSVWTWGLNRYGQLGDGTTTNRKVPVEVLGLASVVGVAIGDEHCLVVKDDGTVWTWGHNVHSQLGDGTAVDRLAPVELSGLSNIVAVSGGAYSSFALGSDGFIRSWGWNSYGALGLTGSDIRSTPERITSISGVTAIAAGDYHAMALGNGGTVWTWGQNNHGQVGNGTMIDQRTPVPILAGMSAIGVGGYHTFAIAGNSTLPTSIDDNFSVPHDSSANSLNVLANDSANIDDPLTIATVAQPAHGAVIIAVGGNGLTYTPAAGYYGGDSFTYTIATGDGTATATVTIAVLPPATVPTISFIAARSIGAGTSTGAISFTVADTATPVADLVVTRSTSNATLVPLSGIVLGGNGANRTVTITPSGLLTGTTTITLTVADGDALSASTSFMLTVLPRPNILNVNPYAAGVGTTVGISGANYTVPGGVTSVTFNGIAASFTQNGSLINAIVPAGNVNGLVRVTTAGGTAVSASNFTLVPTPQVLSFSPLEGGYGTQVSFSGNNLLGATSVRVNGTRATEFTVVSKNLIRFTVPTGCLPGKISVVTPGGTGESANNFVVYPPPGIGSFSPATGNIGSTVSISGNYFSSVQSVKFNNQFTSNFLQVNNNLIRVAVPAGATTGKITVITKGGSVVSSAIFTVILKPSIAVFSPTSGTPGTLVSFSGNNLSGVSISFNGIPATSVTQISAFQVRAVVPVGATTGKVSATNTAGDVGTSSANFTVLQPPAITSFTPATGPAGTGVVISGSNFTGATSVKFNTTTATFAVNGAGQITATVPSGATTGKITVTGPAGSGVSSQSFTVTAGTAPPVINSYSPTSGAAGTTVVLKGTGFGGATAVRFTGASNTQLASNFRVDNAQQITATVPNDTVTGVIRVTTAGGTGVSNGVFTILKSPVIFSFTPTTGPADTAVTLTGANFTGTTSVMFTTPTGTAAAGFSLLTPTSIACNVPTNAISGKISVTNAFGIGQSTTDFLVIPRIESFTPATGPTGTIVTVNGRAFTGVTSVQFNGVLAAFTLVSPTQIRATVPAGATTGVISVTTPGGVGNSVASYTVTP